MERTPDEQPQHLISRRKALTWGGTAAVLVWAVPTVVSWTPSPAHAGTPSPLEEEQPKAQLADTGANLGLLAAAGVTTIAAGAVALRSQRTGSATTPLSLPVPPPRPPSEH